MRTGLADGVDITVVPAAISPADTPTADNILRTDYLWRLGAAGIVEVARQKEAAHPLWQ